MHSAPIRAARHARFFCLLLASSALLPAAAVAQDVQPADPPPEPAAPPLTPEAQAAVDAQERAAEGEIIVTATRRAERLQDVPIAITAIGTKQLEDLNVDDFQDYARLVPSLSFKSGGGGGSADGPGTNNVYFRGVASGPTIRPRCRASAPISTNSRSRRSAARSTSTSSTSRASRRSPVRRAPSTAHPARPAPSASSPTSPTLPRPMGR